MRHYPLNSPEAAARIVAMALLADGHVSKLELDALDKLKAHEALGLDRQDLIGVLQALCEDLYVTMNASWCDGGAIDQRTLEGVLDDVQDPALQEVVLDICRTVIEADHWVSEGESLVLSAAVDRWAKQSQMLRYQRH
jgi:uncharacterized tellurite resistance protein B-like protein